MSQFTFKMPDLGEGTVEAEIVAWHTKPGDAVNEDQIIVEVMTDKAAVEVPAPVSGRVVSITGEPGDKVAVGSPLIVFELAAPAGTSASAAPPKFQTAAPPGAAVTAATPAQPPAPAAVSGPSSSTNDGPQGHTDQPRGSDRPPRVGRVMASPANRRRAREAGIDLTHIAGSGPGGRIVSADLVAAGARLSSKSARDVSDETSPANFRVSQQRTAEVSAETSSTIPASQTHQNLGVAPAAANTTEIKVIGIRRLIAERMSEAKRNIPHFAYVEEVDVTELESLRQHLNGKIPKGEASLTYLPLVVMALTRALESFPQCNVLYDASRGVLVRHRAVHVGIATQTPDGLKVPVVRNAQALPLWDLAAEIRRVSERARSNKSSREDLTGSTITVTSLGKLGGIASTPVINAPEVAIIGLNKAVDRPTALGGAVVVRRIMNLSSSFDHRFVDGYDAAAMIQALKDLLEHPATIFIPR